MKKRLLIILALGISFAPAVFADSGDTRTGQVPSGQYRVGMADCPMAHGADKVVASDSSDSKSGGKSSSADSRKAD